MSAVRISVVAALLLVGGCSEQPAPETVPSQAADVKKNESVVAPVTPPVAAVSDPEASAILALRDAGATVKTNDSGVAIDVSFQKLTNLDSLKFVADLKSLRALNLAESSFSDASLPLLETVTPQLTSLDVRGCELSDKASVTFARFTGLRALKFSGKSGKTTIGDDGLTPLAACKGLKVLALDDLWVSTAGLEALAGLTDLEELYLAGTVVDDDSCKIIAAFPRLRKLRLARTQVSDAALETLSVRTTLEEFDLSENSLITNAGIAQLAKLTALKKLNLWRVQISNEGALQLSSLTKMEWLNLDNSKLSDGGLAALKDMTSLTFLHIGSTQVTEAGAPMLFHLKTLKDLKLTRTALGSSDTAVAELKKNLPTTTVQTEYTEAPPQ